MPPEVTPRPHADEGEVITSLNAIREQMAADARRQNDFNVSLKADVAEVKAETKKTNGRVQSLEQFRFAAKAVIAVLVLQAGWAISVLLSLGG